MRAETLILSIHHCGHVAINVARQRFGSGHLLEHVMLLLGAEPRCKQLKNADTVNRMNSWLPPTMG